MGTVDLCTAKSYTLFWSRYGGVEIKQEKRRQTITGTRSVRVCITCSSTVRLRSRTPVGCYFQRRIMYAVSGLGWKHSRK